MCFWQQFGKAIVCSDTAAEAARYGFTAVDRPEGFLVLAIASLGDEITELKSPPEVSKISLIVTFLAFTHIIVNSIVSKMTQDTTSLEKKKLGVKGLGKKKTDESEHFVWKDDIKVPCGKLVASDHQDSPLEYNEYAVYNPKQVFPLLPFISATSQIFNPEKHFFFIFFTIFASVHFLLTGTHKLLGGSEV